MLYQNTKRFLKRNLKHPSKSYAWQGKDNVLFLNYLQELHSDKEIETGSSEIKEAFREFFESVGSLDFRFDPKEGVHYSIVPYTVSPRSSRHLDKLISIIRENRRSIEYPYQDREDQIALLGKIRRHINAEIAETDEAVNKKELVRYAIKEALELSPRDVVIHLKRKYIIKIFQSNKYLKEEVKEPEEVDPDERRYLGYSAIDLQNHYEEFFNDIDLEDFLNSVMTELFATSLNFEEISNNYYEKHVLGLVRDMIAFELMFHISKNDEYLKGFAGFIFRKNFIAIHEYIAIELFEKISKKDPNAEKFLNYYTGEIYIENGQRYSMPELVTPFGERWNITSITAISNQWLRARSQMDKAKIKLKNVDQNFYEIEDDYKRLGKEYKGYVNELNRLIKNQKTVEHTMQETGIKFKREHGGSMDEKKESELEKVVREDKHRHIDIRKQIAKLQPLKDNAAYHFKGVEAQYHSLLKQKQTLEQEIRTLNQNLKINSDAFHSILHSLVKALMQRKKIIE